MGYLEFRALGLVGNLEFRALGLVGYLEFRALGFGGRLGSRVWGGVRVWSLWGRHQDLGVIQTVP